MTGISDLIGTLRERDARAVALQFPAGLKRRSGEIAATLREEGFTVLISGDPCYGACDLALDLLEYADVLVHFGHTPLISDPRVIYQPYRVDFDPALVEGAIPLFRGETIGLVTTTQHTHLLPAVQEILVSRGYGAVIRAGEGRTPENGQILGCSFSAARIPEATDILVITTGVFHPLGVSLATGAHVVALDPLTGEAQEVDGRRFLMRRHAIIEKARGADQFGIIVSRKPGQNRYNRALELAALSERAYLVFMGEVSPDELLNLGFGAYVNTACPRLAYDDQVRFPVPVLTPAEFEILCGVRDWEDYLIDEIR
ncbi:MAG: diphthamide biosynthesis enzyme Dph2 [Methanomicrobiales archaeon]|nr:diphthamide biosynthesis enzyme Dph2 [Methanomicrobiales archaeon]